jgi:hypothetical protein
MRRYVIIVSSVVIVAAIGWAVWEWFTRPKQVTAAVSCGEVELVQTNLGILNLSQFSLGQYLYVDTTEALAFHGGFIDPGASVTTEAVASLSIGYNARLAVQLSAEVPPAVKADAEEAISRSTRLIANGVRRQTITSVPRAITADAGASSDLQRAIREGVVPVVIHAVVMADSLAIALADTVDGAMNVRLSVDNYEVAVQYQCSQALEVFGASLPVFFKVTPLTYSEPDGFFVDTRVALDFSKIQLAATAR